MTPRKLGAHVQHRRAFNLLELVIAIAILAVLCAILLPAVQWARESARQIHCQNNIRQIATAIHLYDSTVSCLPINMGPWPPTPSVISPLNGKGWIVSILPEVEQLSLYHKLAVGFRGDFLQGHGLRSPECAGAVRTQLPLIQCPSDSSVRELSAEQFQWTGVSVALTSYKGVLGDSQIGSAMSVHTGTIPDCHAVGGCNGLFFRVTYREPQHLSDVHDGLSNTFLVGEDVPEHNHHSAAYYSNGDYSSCHAPLNYFPKPPRPDDWWDVMSFRSRHPRGAFFARADGSVAFTLDAIEHTIYRALSTKAGHEVP